uniref:G8 domain-containing protein n=1 Tax=viral metagenome TaxID=1070528 RepID=A0A6C0BP08_9ZZZZ
MPIKKEYIITIVVVASLLVITGLYFLIRHLTSSSVPDPVPDPSIDAHLPQIVTNTDPRDFHTLSSTDQIRGRLLNGDLVDDNVVISPGLSSVSDLQKYLFTYAMGHPYYDAPHFGHIQGLTWQQYIQAFPSSLRLSQQSSRLQLSPDAVLLVQEPGVLIIDQDLDIRGLVVRHGAVVLFSDLTDLSVRTQFILVESGGVLQAGADGYPYKHQLKFWLSHPPEGYGVMGLVASEYTYEVYAPGVRKDLDQQTFYTGSNMAFMNTFGCKVIAVGFNGNLTLVSDLATPQPYVGTWRAYTSSGETWLDYHDSLTYFDTDEQVTADLVNVETKYHPVWLPLANLNFKAGTKTLKIADGSVPWKSGDHIIITGKSNQYTTWEDPQGLLPLWVNNDSNSEREANLQANLDFVRKFSTTSEEKRADKSNGVEVAIIERVSGDTIYLVDPLQFDHDSTHTKISRDSSNVKASTKTIFVSDGLHVGLLTRNISIESELTSGGTGYGILEGTLAEYNDQSGQWAGPRSTVRCNDIERAEYKATDVASTCYINRPVNNLEFCNNMQPPPVTNGSWIFGSASKTGPNSIFAGHTMFRYGSGTHLKGVELTVMGTTAGFGSVARYPIHYHLSGWSDSFSEYLPPANQPEVGSNKIDLDPVLFRRRHTFTDGSIWRSFNHFVNMHGCHEINFKNNVCFVSFGNGVFVEDGTELNNTIEHNLLGYCLPCVSDTYYNTIPIMPVVSVDTNCGMSVIWLKNNQNRILRNICCDSPSPTIGIWLAPQYIGYLRGPSTVCLGDPIRKLPSLASRSNAIGDRGRQAWLSQHENTWESVKDEVGLSTPCWLPEDILNQDLTTGCLLYTNSNDTNPYLLMAENVCYCLFGGISEFPEAVELPGPNYEGLGQFEGAPGIAYGTGESKVGWIKQPMFIPSNGQNACSDEFARAPYFETKWAGGNESGGLGYAFQPLTSEWLQNYDQKGWTKTQLTGGAILPKIFSNILTYNIGAATDLWGCALWTKQGPSWLINCCFLETSKRVRDKFDGCFDVTCPVGEGYGFRFTTGRNSDGLSAGLPWRSSAAVISCGGDGNQSMYSAIYPVLHNLIVNGGTALPSNPTVLSGSKTFFGNQVILMETEYNAKRFEAACNTYYCYDWPQIFEEFIPKTVWENRQNLQVQGFIDMDRKRAIRLAPGGRSESNLGSEPTQTLWSFSQDQTRKYPYVCGEDHRLFRIGSQTPNQPNWRNIVANAQTHTFLSDQGIQLGDTICEYLSHIPPCSNNIDNSFTGSMCCYANSNCN